MPEIDHTFDVTIPKFLNTLEDAVAHLDTVQPEALREPLKLWFRATAHEVILQNWTSLFGKPVVAVWNAARAVLDHPKQGDCQAKTDTSQEA